MFTKESKCLKQNKNHLLSFKIADGRYFNLQTLKLFSSLLDETQGFRIKRISDDAAWSKDVFPSLKSLQTFFDLKADLIEIAVCDISAVQSAHDALAGIPCFL